MIDNKKILQEELSALRERIIANHRAAGQVASGRTIESMKIEVTDKGGTLYGRQAFGTLETGRKGGKVPYSFSQIIYQWSIDKKLSFQTDSNRRSFAYLVARKIAKDGTELNRTGGINDIYSNEIPKTIEAIHKRVLRIFESQIDNIDLN